jgi:hypothetical protein
MKLLHQTCALLAFAGGALTLQGQIGTLVGFDNIPGSAGNYSRTNHSSSIAINRDSSGSFDVVAQAGSHYLRFGGGTGNNSVREFTGWLTNGFTSGHLVRPGTYTASIDVSRGGGSVLTRDTFDSLEFRLITVGQTEIGQRTVIEPYVIPQQPSEWTTVVVSYVVEPDSPLIGQRLTWAIRATFPPSGTGSFGPVDNIVVYFEEGGDWITDYQEIPAPFDLAFGTEAGRQSEGDLLRSRPGDFVLQPTALRYSPTSPLFLSSAALAVVDGYLNRQDFSLEADMTLADLADADDNRVGFAVLAGPHNVPDQPFNTLDDSGFYGLVWYPANAAGNSVLQVREGFNGSILAEKAWEGRRPFAGGSILYQEDFEDLSAVNAAWTIAGMTPLWEFGQPAGARGPTSAVSGIHVAATGLNQNYPIYTEARLRSPLISLNGADQATLSFHEFTDVDPAMAGSFFYHSTRVRLLRSDLTELAVLSQRAEIMTDWALRQYPIPQVAIDHGEFIIEFFLESDDASFDVYAGWFIDDVVVSSQETESYTLQATGTYDISGILQLTFTLTDGNNFSDSVSAFVADPIAGNLFGLGGRTRNAQTPTFDFHRFSMAVGDAPTAIVPTVEAPFAFSFGSDSGRYGGEDFLPSNPSDWELRGSSWRLTTASGDYQASLSATRVWNFEPGHEFLLGANFTLTNLDGGVSENRVGLVLFGEEDPNVFSPANDGSYYTLEWTPNKASGGSLSIRQGFNGAMIATTDFGGLENPPQPVAGASYEFRLAATAGGPGEAILTGVLLDGVGGRALVSGTVSVGVTETRFGLGARHRLTENAIWDFHTFSWSEDVPLAMPLNYQFGTAGGRDGDADFTKTGGALSGWSLESQSLQISREDTLLSSTIPNANASTSILDYGAGGNFVVRATMSASDAETHLGFNADGGHIETPVTGNDLGIAGNNPRTIEAWAYARTFDNNATIWTYGDNGPLGADFSLKVTGTQDRWVVNQWSASDVFVDVPGSGNRWVHFAVVHTGEETIVYVDGVLAVQAPRTLITGGTRPFRMGWWFHRAVTTGLNGAIREVRVWNEARSEADILANLNASLTGNEPGLVAYWPLNEGQGLVVNDLAGGNHGVFTAANSATGALPEWTGPRVGLTFLGGNAGLTDSYSFQWESMNLPGSGLLRLNGPAGTGSLASVELASVTGAPSFAPGSTYTMQVNGFFNPNGSLSLSGILEDGLGGVAEVAANIANPVTPSGVTWFGVTGRAPVLNWHSFEMGTPGQLGVEEPPAVTGDTFAAWRAANFVGAEAENDAISGPLAMPAGDGVANLLKYAFGFEPLATVTSRDLTTVHVGDGTLEITYRERRGATDIEYLPQASAALASWSAEGVIELTREIDPDQADFDLVTVRATLAGGAERGFLRVLVREVD